MITYAIGDIHGCLDELIQLIIRIQDYHAVNHPDKTIKFVFVGDYIDRGPDSKGVIDYLIDFSTVQECVFLRGNHEDMLMHNLGLMMINGGSQTLMSYGWNSYMGSPKAWIKDFFPEDHWNFVRTTKLWYKDSLRTYVHAGINRNRGDVENQIANTLLWTREEFLYDESMDGGYVVHGHTPIGIEAMANRCNIDSACVFGGYLSAAVFTEDEVEPIHFLKSDFHEKSMKGPV